MVTYLLQCFRRTNSVLIHLATLDRTAFFRPLFMTWFRATSVRNILRYLIGLILVRPDDRDGFLLGFWENHDRPFQICRSLKWHWHIRPWHWQLFFRLWKGSKLNLWLNVGFKTFHCHVSSVFFILIVVREIQLS